jgi:hypothetical protein
MSKYNVEEAANIAIRTLQVGISTERNFVTEAHRFHDKLYSWDVILGHLYKITHGNKKHFHKLLDKIVGELMEIRDTIESYEADEIHIIQKESVGASKKQWKIVKKLEGKEVQLEKTELIELHSMFNELFNLMSEHRVIKALQKDFATKKEIEEYEKAEHYYLSQIFRFVRAYEKILSKMI